MLDHSVFRVIDSMIRIDLLITDTDYLYVYVPITDMENRYLLTVIK